MARQVNGVTLDVVMSTNSPQTDIFRDAHGVEFFIHPAAKCAGTRCALHNPSDHRMKDWPRVMRFSTLIERQCEHGVGHPDPDSMAFLEKRGSGALGVHGCDGCCHKEK